MVLQEARSDLRDPRGFHAQTHGTGSVSLVNNCSIVKLGKMAANINEVNIPPPTSPAVISNRLMKFPLPGRLHLLMGIKNMPVF